MPRGSPHATLVFHGACQTMRSVVQNNVHSGPHCPCPRWAQETWNAMGMPWECHGNAMGITIDSDRLRDVSKCFILSRVTLHELSILYNLYVLFCFVLPLAVPD